MSRSLAEPHAAIVYLSKFREYGISILDGGSAFQEIRYCPWCGGKLPLSLRDEWFDELERLEMEPGDENIPHEYLSDEWWLQRDNLP